MANMNSIKLYHHLGLGDHFICNGLVNAIAKRYDQLFLPCWQRYLKTVSHLYSDFDNIKVYPIDQEPSGVYDYEPELPVIRVGFEQLDPSGFERSFYSQLGLPYETRFTEFRLPRDLTGSSRFLEQVQRDLGNDYIFVHNQSSVGKFDLSIASDLPQHVSQVSDTPNVIDYVDTLKNAKEIHVINSSIIALVINLYQCGMLSSTRVFYHDVRKISQGGIPLEIPSQFETIYYV